MSDRTSSRAPPARAPRPLLGAVVLWCAASGVVWFSALLAEYSHRKFHFEPYRAPAVYLLTLAAGSTAALGAPLGVLHLVRRRYGGRAAAALVLIAGGWISWHEARFLTGGDAIAASSWRVPLLAGLAVGLTLAVLAVWIWHVAGTAGLASVLPRGVPASSGLRSTVRWTIWAVAGAVAACGAAEATLRWYATYAFFTTFLTVLGCTVAATLVFRVLAAAGRPGRALAAGCAAVLAAGALAPAIVSGVFASGRSLVLVRCAAIAPFDRFVPGRPDPTVRFDVDRPEHFSCRGAGRIVEGPVPVAAAARRNVLLITFDGLRRDAVAAEVGGKPLMPALRRFGRSGIDFRRATTHYPATLLSFAGALTGLTASSILLAPHPPETFLTRLRSTFDAVLVTMPAVHWFGRRAIRDVLLRGASVHPAEGAEAQNAWLIAALRAARRRGARTFAWIHFYETHRPWTAHPGYDLGGSERARYLSEAAFVDAQFGVLARYLREDGWLDDSLVIVFSDHGEGLGERGHHGHHVYLDGFLTDVPLMVHAPGVRPRRSDAMADVTDVAATVLHFVGADPMPGSEGRSLLGSGVDDPERLRVGEAFPVRGHELFDLTARPVADLDDLRDRLDWVQGRTKSYLPKVSAVTSNYRLIVDRLTGAEELFERDPDHPERERDVGRARPDVVRELRSRLRAWHAEQSRLVYCRMKERVR